MGIKRVVVVEKEREVGLGFVAQFDLTSEFPLSRTGLSCCNSLWHAKNRDAIVDPDAHLGLCKLQIADPHSTALTQQF